MQAQWIIHAAKSADLIRRVHLVAIRWVVDDNTFVVAGWCFALGVWIMFEEQIQQTVNAQDDHPMPLKRFAEEWTEGHGCRLRAKSVSVLINGKSYSFVDVGNEFVDREHRHSRSFPFSKYLGCFTLFEHVAFRQNLFQLRINTTHQNDSKKIDRMIVVVSLWNSRHTHSGEKLEEWTYAAQDAVEHAIGKGRSFEWTRAVQGNRMDEGHRYLMQKEWSRRSPVSLRLCDLQKEQLNETADEKWNISYLVQRIEHWIRWLERRNDPESHVKETTHQGLLRVVNVWIRFWRINDTLLFRARAGSERNPANFISNWRILSAQSTDDLSTK